MTKDLLRVALDTIARKYGTGAERKTLLTNAGYDYNEVQSLVNDIVKDMSQTEFDKLLISIAADYENTLETICIGRG